jgi:hypothetical protein
MNNNGNESKKGKRIVGYKDEMAIRMANTCGLYNSQMLACCDSLCHQLRITSRQWLIATRDRLHDKDELSATYLMWERGISDFEILWMCVRAGADIVSPRNHGYGRAEIFPPESTHFPSILDMMMIVCVRKAIPLPGFGCIGRDVPRILRPEIPRILRPIEYLHWKGAQVTDVGYKSLLDSHTFLLEYANPGGALKKFVSSNPVYKAFWRGNTGQVLRIMHNITEEWLRPNYGGEEGGSDVFLGIPDIDEIINEYRT